MCRTNAHPYVALLVDMHALRKRLRLRRNAAPGSSKQRPFRGLTPATKLLPGPLEPPGSMYFSFMFPVKLKAEYRSDDGLSKLFFREEIR